MTSRQPKTRADNRARKGTPSSREPSRDKPDWTPVLTLALLCVAVLAATLLAHWPVLDAQAINLDDQRYLFDNPVLQNPSWSSAITVLCEVTNSSTVRGYYEPLTLLSLMLDVTLGGTQDNLRVFHITSLALHLLNTLLVIVLVYMLFRQAWAAACVGLIFGVHPLTVEPVAWVWERKTLLSAFFALWCIIFYIRHVRRPSLAGHIGIPTLFVLALMAKPTVTPLPALLLLLDYWPLRRLNVRAIIEKIPLFAVAVVSSVITVVSTARTGSATLLGDYSLFQLPLKICYLLAFYLFKMIWPAHLSSIYLLPKPMSLSNPWVLGGVVCSCVLVALLVISLRRTRAAVMAGLFFIVAMSPTLGVVQYSWVAASDKYVYIPAFGLLIALAALLEQVAGDLKNRPTWRPAAVGAVVVTAGILLIVNTRSYLSQWSTTRQLTTYMLHWAPESPYAQFCHANVLNNDKEYDQAITHFDRAIELKPDFAMAYNNRGSAFASINNYDLAIRDCGKAVEFNPDYVEAYYNRGIAYMGKADYDRAIQDYNKAIELSPNDAKVYSNRANAYAAKGDFDRAIRDGGKAIELRPRFADAYYNRAIAYGKKGDHDQAIRDYTKAIEIEPNFVKAYNNRGLAYNEKGDRDRAIQDLNKALKLDPNDPEAGRNRSFVHRSKGDFEQAIRDYSKAIDNNPNDADAYFNRGVAYDGKGDYDGAIQDFTKAIEIRPDHLEAYNLRATAYGAKGDFDRTIQDCNKALELKSDYESAYYNRGNAYGAKGDHAQAVSDFSKAIELKPANTGAYYNRSIAYFTLKEYDKAWADVKKCRELGGTPDPTLVKKLEEATGRTE